MVAVMLRPYGDFSFFPEIYIANKILTKCRGKAFAPQYSNSSQKISVRKCFTLFAPIDKFSLRCEVWA
jgi:hypothetical protein